MNSSGATPGQQTVATPAFEPEINNVFGRVQAVVIKAVEIIPRERREKTATVNAWAMVFKVSEENLYVPVASQLCFLNGQIDVGYKLLEAKRARLDKYRNGIESARSFLSPQALTTMWNHTLDRLKPSAIEVLGTAADRLEDEDQESIPGSRIDEILSMIAALEESVGTGKVPPDLEHFLKTEIEILRGGIENYFVQGLDGFRVAVEVAIGKWTVSPPSTWSPHLGDLYSLLKLSVTTVRDAAKTGKVLVELPETIEKIRKLISGEQ